MFSNNFCFLFSKTCFDNIKKKKIMYFQNQKHVWLVELKKNKNKKIKIKKPEKVILKIETFFFSIHFELSNKFSSLKNRKLFLEIENRKKKQLPNIP